MSGATQPAVSSGLWRMWLAALFWGFNWPAVKIMLETSPPWSLRAAGLAGGAAFLITACLVTRTPLSIPRAFWRDVASTGTLSIAMFNICAIFAQLSMPTSRAAILTFTMPLWASLFAWMFLGEKIDCRRALALLLGFSGILILSVSFWPVIAQGGVPFGLVYVFGASICWALGTVYQKAHPMPAAPLTITAWQVLIAAVICTVCMLLFEQPRLDLSKTPQFAAFLYHIILPQGVAYLLFFQLVRRVSAATASVGTLLIPIFGVIGAIILLDDWPTKLDLIGLALILSAVLLDQVRSVGWVRRGSVP